MEKEKEERVKRRAFNIWCAEGWPKGRHEEHWAQACREEEAGAASMPSATPIEASSNTDGATRQPDASTAGLMRPLDLDEGEWS